MATVAPPEEVALAVFGSKTIPIDDKGQDGSDGEAAALWVRDGDDVSGKDRRPNPEGSREEAVLARSVDDEAFSKEEEEEEEEEEANAMPEAAAHVFVPIDPYCIERSTTAHEKDGRDFEEQRGPRGGGKADPERQNFVSHGYSAHFDDLPGDVTEHKTCADRWPCFRNGTCSSANLKAVASMLAATVIFPCLLYGAYVFLPFDVPLMPTMGARLVYALRCGVFATFPIVIGMIVYGVSRLCFSSLQPFGELRREVEIHRHYVSQSVHLFILYFFNIAVLATYLPQEGLKLIPLLTGLFAIARLLYWLAYAMGRSFRGFGFGLTFLPLVTMLLFNLYSMFLMDSESMFATGDAPAEHKATKPRYWG
ncbi:transmembrane protein 79 [Anolis carolinensis]|uniref:Transmembrane protein 79 n=1 Tax=Anolis carolinensis TaxID=28377 RepID=R4GDK5_ANOCA|nr:PREDICTED: transmembrane protein 79 [Anolis carolinensis]|eukprot:XP_003229982.1 PREDICTED: transmembrane protein 79 [Anolis carolinensis]